MYTYADSYSESVTEEHMQHAMQSAMPALTRLENSPNMARGGRKDGARPATVQATGEGGAVEAAAQTSHPWFLAYTRPGQEQLAQQNLSLQGYESYLPQYRRVKKTAGEKTVVVEPLFPRYVFFRPERAGQSITPVRSTRGISHIVRFGEMPATVQSNTLGIIRRLEQERNLMGEDAVESLQPGQKVRFLDAAFEGLEGLVKAASRRRVAVLLELLGRQQVVYASPHRVTFV